MSFYHGKVDTGEESTSFYHVKVDIDAPILDAVTNFGGKRRFGSRGSQRVAGAHGRIGRSTGLGKELGLVYIYIYIY